jgi:hypothetical protein
MSSGRFVYLGSNPSYPNPYRVEIDYTNGPTIGTWSSPSFAQVPGVVFAIPNMGTAIALRLYDAVTGALLGSFNSFDSECGTCWATGTMAGTAGPWKFTWDPTRAAVVVMDQNIFADPPHHE